MSTAEKCGDPMGPNGCSLAKGHDGNHWSAIEGYWEPRELLRGPALGRETESENQARRAREGEDQVKKSGCTVYKDYCFVHDFVHGAEAEELRKGVENLLARLDDEDDQPASSECAFVLRRLLEGVDARDSVAFLESRKRPRAKVTARSK